MDDPIIEELEELLQRGGSDEASQEGCLARIKEILLQHNLSDFEPLDISQPPQSCSLRGRLWKAILGVPCDFSFYEELLNKALGAKYVSLRVERKDDHLT